MTSTQPPLAAIGQRALQDKFRQEAICALGPDATDRQVEAASENLWRAHLTRMAVAGGAVKSREAAASRPSQLNDRDWLQQAVAMRGVREIAAELGCGSSTVHRAVKRLGIDMRTSQNHEKMRPLIGKRFGMLTVREGAAPTPRSGNLRVLADCDCGGTKIATIWTLENHGPGWDHCGCQSAARWADGSHARTHGQSGSGGRKRATPTYLSWQAMRDRCYRPSTNGYESHGARGIQVCDRWRYDFAAFLEDMGERPPGTTLDRYPDNDGNYEPGNCRWATPAEQIANRRQCAWLSGSHWQVIFVALSEAGTPEAGEALAALSAQLNGTARRRRKRSAQAA